MLITIVRWDRKIYTFEVMKTIKICELKTLIQKEKSYSVEHFKLTYLHQSLELQRTLQDYHFESGARINMELTIGGRGGMQIFL